MNQEEKLKCERPLFAALLILFAFNLRVPAQGTFQNLNFESANVTGVSPGSSISAAKAFPGWTTSLSPVYDAISIGGPLISVIDRNVGVPGAGPLQGNFSAFLFGSQGVTATLSQTGSVPNGTQSLLMDVYVFTDFDVTINGQQLNMVPLSGTSNDRVYGADISSFAGQTATLSLIVPPVATPNAAEFDSITFSPNPIPEPATLSLLLCGAGLLGAIRYARSKSNS